jgi:hypothetical protein
MKVAILNFEQHRQLIGQRFTDSMFYNPVLISSGYIILSEQEIDQTTEQSLLWVKDLPLVELDTLTPPDTTPPTLTPYAVEIPTEFQWVFVGDKITIGGFYIPLDNYNSIKVVNLAYFSWVEFRKELDSGKYQDLKSALMPLWDYVATQVANNNIIIL